MRGLATEHSYSSTGEGVAEALARTHGGPGAPAGRGSPAPNAVIDLEEADTNIDSSMMPGFGKCERLLSRSLLRFC